MSVVRSMTGFASVAGSVGEQTSFALTIKSVNHRFLDLHLRLPSGCEALEMRLRRLLKERVGRGHVEVTLAMDRAAGGALRLEERVLDGYVRMFRRAAEAHGLGGDPDLNAMLRLPGVISTEAAPREAVGEAFEGAVVDALERALVAFQAMREAEGQALAEELRGSMRRILDLGEEVGGLRAAVPRAQMERLRERLEELTGGAEVPHERLLAEIAVLVERSDVQEELVRLRTHAERFLALLEEGGELGKRTDFLLQELNREANTLLSKTGGSVGEEGLRITEMGLGIKAEIERAREQVQNLE